ncbi:MAG: helix-turn-helix transcriptional regulator [Anaerolineae bacterium]|nr:helix-turn-helix transcriptional regulator [Anaerolineae bacterium]
MDERIVSELEMLHERICYALGDTKRLMILYLLSAAPHTVNDIAADLNMPQPTVSHHLKILRERRLVRATREGTSVHYAMAEPRVVQALDLLRGVLRDTLADQARLADSTLLAPETPLNPDPDEDDDST